MKHETMPLTHAQQYERALDTTWRDGELPPLTTVDRVALRLGVRLILWGQRHAERTERAEQARRSGAAEQAAADARAAFERRTAAGPTW